MGESDELVLPRDYCRQFPFVRLVFIALALSLKQLLQHRPFPLEFAAQGIFYGCYHQQRQSAQTTSSAVCRACRATPKEAPFAIQSCP